MVKRDWWKSGLGTSREVLGEEQWPLYLHGVLEHVELQDRTHRGESVSYGVRLTQLWRELKKFDLPGLDVPGFSEAVCKMVRDRSRPQKR